MHDVRHNEPGSRFEIELDGKHAVAEYERRGEALVFTHTEVPPEYRHRGIGGELARAGLEYARREGVKVVPQCPFIAAYIREHPEFAELRG